MNQFDLLRRFHEYGGKSAPPLGTLAAEFLEASQTLGFRYLACCSHVDPIHPPPHSVMLHNYPRGWVRTFSETRLYQIDPVLLYAESTLFPFFWDVDLRREKLTRAQQIIMAEAAGYGLRNGYTVPIQLSRAPGSLRASCSVIPDGPRIDPQSYVTIGVLATYFYILASRSHMLWLVEPTVKLTRRERQCLTLVAKGNTDAEIARILGLSTSTAHYHIEHAKQRLRAVTRPQAIMEAFAMGQIPFEDYSSGD